MKKEAKIEITCWRSGRVLFAHEAEHNTIKVFGFYSGEDRRFERAMYESIDKHRAALLERIGEGGRNDLRQGDQP